MADAKTSILIEADGSQAKAEFQGVSNAAKNLEKHIANAAKGSKTSANGIATSAENAAKRGEAANKRFMRSLETMAATYGKPKSAALEYKAAQRGMSEAAAPFIAQIKAVENAGGDLGMSAKQTANAMRLIPMQMTDIVTQLAGGQNPLLILTQQGGQLKDVFGGIGPALRGVGAYISALINPITVAAAAVGTVVVAYQMGANEAERFNESLTMTGNFAGLSADQMSDMAKQISETTGTTGQAADALNKLAATGKVAGSQFEAIGKAAVAMEIATGQAIEDTIADFVKLGEEPSKAIAKLNESQHFLTSAIYEQITALEEQGRTQEAAQLAQQTYAQAITDRANSVIKDTGLMERSWNALAGAAKSAWNAMMDIGRTGGLVGQLSEAQDKLAQLQDGAYERGSARRVKQVEEQKAIVADLQERIRMENSLAVKQREQTQIQADAIAAQDAINRSREQSATRLEKMNAELDSYRSNIEKIRKADPNSALLDPVKIAADEAAIRERFRDKKGGGSKEDKDPLGTFIKGEDLQYQLGEYQKFLDFIDKATGRAQARQKEQQQIWMDDALRAGEVTYGEYYKTIDGMSVLAGKKFDEMGQFGIEAARGIQRSLGDGLYDILKGNFDNIGEAFYDTLLKMVANAASVNLSQALFGDGFDKGGGLGGIIGSVAGSLFGGGGSGNLSGGSVAGATWGAQYTFASGGYTGPGAKYEPKGLVHAEEGVLNRDEIRALGGPSGFNALRRAIKGRGHAMGGMAGSPALPAGGATGGGIVINVSNESSQPVTASQPKFSMDEMGRTVINFMIQDAHKNGPYVRTLKGVMG